MKYLLLISLFLGMASVFAQSKKKQIEQLQHRLDSIEIVNRDQFRANDEFRLEINQVKELLEIVTYELKIAGRTSNKKPGALFSNKRFEDAIYKL